MKKILLTLIAGFCLGSVAMAQEPSKTAKRKANPISLTATPTNNAAKERAKEAKAKALDAGKATKGSPAQVSKASEVAENIQ